MIPGTLTDYRTEDVVSIDDTEYMVEFQVWQWRSPDRTEKDENEISIIRTIPETDDEHRKIIQTELEDKYL